MGTSKECISWNRCAKDHPHAYGDKSRTGKRPKVELGSSPRVWGQDFHLIMASDLSRIIPTRMGTSFRRSSRWYAPQDHPHAYGDKTISATVHCRSQGSSPRVWGQANWSDQRLREIRIIPTRMGTRGFPVRNAASVRDHPHAYGDKTKEIKENSGFAKSTA